MSSRGLLKAVVSCVRMVYIHLTLLGTQTIQCLGLNAVNPFFPNVFGDSVIRFLFHFFLFSIFLHALFQIIKVFNLFLLFSGRLMAILRVAIIVVCSLDNLIYAFYINILMAVTLY